MNNDNDNLGKEKSPLLVQLEMYGDPRKITKWANGKRANGKDDYVAKLGLTADDVPELLAIAKKWIDSRDDWPDDKKYVAGYAPIHAWRCLAQLRVPEAIPVLLEMLDPLDKSEDDWYLTEFPEMFGCFGEAALGPLREYLADGTHGVFPRIAVSDGLAALAKAKTQASGEAVQALLDVLSRVEDAEPELNGFIVANLLDLKDARIVTAEEIADVIEQAHAADCVHPSVCGNWNAVRKELGIEGTGLVSEALASREIGLMSPLGDVDDDDFFGDDEGDGGDEKDDEEFSPDVQVNPLFSDTPAAAPIRSTPKIGRNDPCPCGSGKKYKKCCAE